MTVKIVKLTAENFKRLSAVEITPEGNVIQITGKNRAGKTSVLDAIFAALGGKNAVPDVPIREGERSAAVEVDLGDMIVTRTFTQKGGQQKTTLKVTSREGAIYQKPQQMLDGLIGRMSFDPHAFMRMDAKKQYEVLRGIVDMTIDIDEVDGLIKAEFDARTEVNRDLKSLQARHDEMTVPPNTPDEPIDTAVVMEELRAGEQNNKRIDDLNVLIDSGQATVDRLKAEMETAENAIAEHASELTELSLVETDTLRETIANASQINQAVNIKKGKAQIGKDLKASEKTAQGHTDKIDDLRQSKIDALKEAKFPVPGLSFEDGLVTYNDLPMSQASGAEQLRISMAIAISANPDIRVIRITDASLLDSDSMAMIEELAESEDFQIWLEVVDESGEVGVVIEDGAVKEDTLLKSA